MPAAELIASQGSVNQFSTSHAGGPSLGSSPGTVRLIGSAGFLTGSWTWILPVKHYGDFHQEMKKFVIWLVWREMFGAVYSLLTYYRK